MKEKFTLENLYFTAGIIVASVSLIGFGYMHGTSVTESEVSTLKRTVATYEKTEQYDLYNLIPQLVAESKNISAGLDNLTEFNVLRKDNKKLTSANIILQRETNLLPN